jgi:hypothetical protein
MKKVNVGLILVDDMLAKQFIVQTHQHLPQLNVLRFRILTYSTLNTELCPEGTSNVSTIKALEFCLDGEKWK